MTASTDSVFYPKRGDQMTPNPSLPAAPVEAVVPSDEQIEHLWDIHVGEPTASRPLTAKDKVAFARAVLALSLPAVLVEPAAEIEKWRKFAAHCQRVVAAIKLKMSPEQAVEFMGEEIDRKIANLAAQDTSDLDPDLLAYIEGWFAERESAAPAVPLEQPAGQNVHPTELRGKFPDAAGEGSGKCVRSGG